MSKGYKVYGKEEPATIELYVDRYYLIEETERVIRILEKQGIECEGMIVAYYRPENISGFIKISGIICNNEGYRFKRVSI